MLKSTAYPESLQDVESIASNLLAGFRQGAVEEPANGLTQVANKLGAELPELHLSGPEIQIDTVAGTIGKIAGKALGFCLLTRALGSIGAVGLSVSPVKMGVLGAGYNGLFEPTDPASKSFFRDRAANAATGFGTFATMGASYAGLERYGLLAAPAHRTFAGSLTGGSIAGIAGGAANAEINAIIREGRWANGYELAADALGFGLFGAIHAGFGHGLNRVSSRTARALDSGGKNSGETVYTHAGEIAIRPWSRFGFPGSEQRVVRLDPAEANAVQKNVDAVVKILPFRNDPATGGMITGGAFGIGTGFIVDKSGTIATAKHVVYARNGVRADGAIVQLQNGERRLAEFVESRTEPHSREFDIDLLRINSAHSKLHTVGGLAQKSNEDFPFVKLAESSKLVAGNSVIALGFHDGRGLAASPGRFASPNTERSLWAEAGSGVKTRAKTGSFPRHVSNIDVESGNSGGPLIRTSDGAVVGIVTERSEGGNFLTRLFQPVQGISEPIEGLKKLRI